MEWNGMNGMEGDVSAYVCVITCRHTFIKPTECHCLKCRRKVWTQTIPLSLLSAFWFMFCFVRDCKVLKLGSCFWTQAGDSGVCSNTRKGYGILFLVCFARYSSSYTHRHPFTPRCIIFNSATYCEHSNQFHVSFLSWYSF